MHKSSYCNYTTSCIKPPHLNSFELNTLQNFCQTIAAAGEAGELELLQQLEPSQKKQLWATLAPELRQALQALAAGGAA